jgi:hypothetical protein
MIHNTLIILIILLLTNLTLSNARLTFKMTDWMGKQYSKYYNFMSRLYIGKDEIKRIDNYKYDLNTLLFPNQTNEYNKRIRKLQSNNTEDDNFECVECSGLKVCIALNTKSIQEVYLPNNLAEQGTCVVLDSLGNITICLYLFIYL